MGIVLKIWHEKHWGFQALQVSALILFLMFLLNIGVATTATFTDSAEYSRFETQWPKTDFSRSSVSIGEILSGGPPKDGIPAIDHPYFVNQKEADAWLDLREPVIVLEVNHQVRAYPLQILIYHEIVNDTVGRLPVAVTFCPLCNAAIVFDRRIPDKNSSTKERILDFGTTGKLRKSDMVMYDRQTESWWQQFVGEAIIGELTGTVLKQLPAAIVSYQDFKTTFPAAMVLSRDTGHSRPYGRNPYRGYDSITDRPFLFNDPVDKRLPAMERVLGISISSSPESITHKIYPLSILENIPVLNDEVNTQPIVIFSKQGMLSVLDNTQIKDSHTIPAAKAYDRRISGRTLHFVNIDGNIFDSQSNSQWNLFGKAIAGPMTEKQLRSVDGGVHFAFAWLAFQPDSIIYREETPQSTTLNTKPKSVRISDQ
jgi:hypothetical protein